MPAIRTRDQEETLVRVIHAQAAASTKPGADFGLGTGAKHRIESYFAAGFDLRRLRKMFERYLGKDPHVSPSSQGKSPQLPFLWSLEWKLERVLDPTIKVSSVHLQLVNEIDRIIVACATLHPQVNVELEAKEKEEDQRIQDRWGPKRVAPGPSPFETFTGGEWAAKKQA